MFDYSNAFSRNLGFVNTIEQDRIKNFCIAVPGMGGVGGHHVHSLVRLGFQNFKIADFDLFEVHNFNRQIGAKMSSIGKTKVDTMKDMILDINPNASVECFYDGINENNYDSFLEGADLLIDGLDVFVIEPRIGLFAKAKEKNIPMITAAPLGMGSSALFFGSKGMDFSTYFQFSEDDSSPVKLSKLLVGVAPKSYHMGYMKYLEYVDPSVGKVPSLHTGALMATSIVSSIVLKYVLDRGEMLEAPYGLHIDLFYNRLSKFWVPFGNANPIQRTKIKWVENSLYTRANLQFAENS